MKVQGLLSIKDARTTHEKENVGKRRGESPWHHGIEGTGMSRMEKFQMQNLSVVG